MERKQSKDKVVLRENDAWISRKLILSVVYLGAESTN